MGVVLVISGPSGVGKDSIVNELIAQFPTLWFAPSATTRAPRVGEVDGIDYIFMTEDEFTKTRDAGGFLEWVEVHGELKGTPRAPLEEALARGQSVVLRKEPIGALEIKKQIPDAIAVFIMPPSREAQRQRLVERGLDSTEAIERRLADAEQQESMADQFDVVVINDELEDAVAQVAAILSES